VLAELTRDDGPGIVTADVEPGRVAPSGEVDDRFWVHPLDPFSEYAGWRFQNRLGKRWYRRRGPGSRIAA
jgi:hypothetical protein